MAYGICRVMKVKSTGVGSMQYHNDRLPGEHSNPNIDPERRRENVEFIEHGSYRAEVKDRIERYRESDRKVRKDAVVLVEGVVTASPEFFEGKSRDEVMAYFRDAFEFVKAEFGEQNLIHYTVHFDEVTPHAHFGAVPIKDGTLAWKKFFDGRAALKGWQDRFHEQVSSRYGLERGEQDTGRTHKDAAQMRRDAEREVAAMETRAADLTREVEESSERLECLRQEVAELEPLAVTLGESARTLIEHRGDESREREAVGYGQQLGSRAAELEQQVRAARERAGELEREVERLGVGVRDAGSRLDRVRERVTQALGMLGWVPKGLSDFATSIGRSLGLRVRDAFSVKMDLARDGAAAWNAAHATRGASRDHEGKQTR